VREPNISPWRRKITGDLLSAFDFREHNTSIPILPDTAAMQRAVDKLQPTLPSPALPPADAQEQPVQQPGVRPARALPYQPMANATLVNGQLNVALANQGSAAVQLSLHPKGSTPSSHLVDAAGTATATVPAADGYDVTLLGPNGFLRTFSGKNAGVEVAVTPRGSALRFAITNSGSGTARITLANGKRTRVIPVAAGAMHAEETNPSHGWYDLTFTVAGDAVYLRRFAGHVENGKPSVTTVR
jgi:phospholipase C